MLFTSDLNNCFLEKNFRLQKDGTWRSLPGERAPLHENDFVTDTPASVPGMRGTTVQIGDETFRVNPRVYSFGEKDILFHASTAFRKEFPAQPSYDQLKEAMTKGDDKIHNILIVNVNGLFETRQQLTPNVDPSIAVRFETFPANGGYIGREAAQDEDHLKGLYSAALHEWGLHLRTGRIECYNDTYALGQYVNAQKDLDDIKANWKPGH